MSDVIDREEIRLRFVDSLKEFADNEFVFDSENALREGTQREAFTAFTTGIENKHTHGYKEIPTGVGKTATFVAIAKSYLKAAENQQQVLITVPTEKLVKQTVKSFQKFMPELFKFKENGEIDWDNSDIGMQYGDAKHAGFKPRVLITTNQSLSRDVHDKTYPPQDFGLVIYDEGDVITAPKFSEAVTKFKNSIQLGITATAAYSPEKSLEKILEHKYYGLSLAEAINRGDLCNVRPVLLKTDCKIDEKKFAEFIKKQKGKPLTDKQLETLLNQETRNRAALEAYLTASDPDSEERYLGQNGAIYCGGITHTNDVVELANRLLNDEAAYQPIKKWLESENK
ncbi:MAG: DEAD/DEAH box helicase family protein [Pseudomonadota bacterium]